MTEKVSILTDTGKAVAFVIGLTAASKSALQVYTLGISVAIIFDRFTLVDI